MSAMFGKRKVPITRIFNLFYIVYEDKHTTESSKHNQLKEEKHIKIG
jgi:hypothetical protein